MYLPLLIECAPRCFTSCSPYALVLQTDELPCIKSCPTFPLSSFVQLHLEPTVCSFTQRMTVFHDTT